MMKCLPVLLLLVMLGSGCQKNNGDQASAESANAKELEEKPLTPIPDEMTLEFVRKQKNRPASVAGGWSEDGSCRVGN